MSPLTLVGSTRADDIVRDADILHLYKTGRRGPLPARHRELRRSDAARRSARAGTTSHGPRGHPPAAPARHPFAWRPGWSGSRRRPIATTGAACGSCSPTIPTRSSALRHAAPLDAVLSDCEAERRVIQTDQRRWDYKHQVLATPPRAPWRVLLWVKLIEAVMQLRPRVPMAGAGPSGPRPFAQAMRWYYRIGRQVWPYEIWHFLFRDRRTLHGPRLADFWANPQPIPAIQPRLNKPNL